ncbi:hypothetical protein D3C83_57770 [compost metagenome]
MAAAGCPAAASLALAIVSNSDAFARSKRFTASEKPPDTAKSTLGWPFVLEPLFVVTRITPLAAREP